MGRKRKDIELSEFEAAIENLKAEGKKPTLSEIAEALNCSESFVYTHLRDTSLFEKETPTLSFTKEQVIQAIETIKASGGVLNFKTIGKVLGVTQPTVARYCKRYQLYGMLEKNYETSEKSGWKVAKTSGKGRYYLKGGHHSLNVLYSDTAIYENNILQVFCNARTVHKADVKSLKRKLNTLFGVTQSILVDRENRGKLCFEYTTKLPQIPSEQQMEMAYFEMNNSNIEFEE